MWRNTVEIAGNVGKAPTSGKTKNGDTFAAFSVAVNSRSKDGSQGTPDWIHMMAFGPVGDAILERIQKGTPVVITGTLKTYMQNNIQRYYVRVNSFAEQKITKTAAAEPETDNSDIPV